MQSLLSVIQSISAIWYIMFGFWLKETVLTYAMIIAFNFTFVLRIWHKNCTGDESTTYFSQNGICLKVLRAPWYSVHDDTDTYHNICTKANFNNSRLER